MPAPKDGLVRERTALGTPERDLRRTIREARRNRGGTSRKAALLIATAVLAVGLFGGYAMAASVLTTTNVQQHASQYGVTSTSGSVNWPSAPSVLVSTAPSGTTACNSTGSYGTASVRQYFDLGVNGTCAPSDFVEELDFASAASLVSQIDYFSVYASWVDGSGVTHSGSATLTLTVTAGTSSGAIVSVDVDFGTFLAPPTVTQLTCIVHS